MRHAPTGSSLGSRLKHSLPRLLQSCHKLIDPRIWNSTMKRTIKKLAGVLATNINPVEHGVHFHPGPAGPYVCENPRCVSPGLDETEVT